MANAHRPLWAPARRTGRLVQPVVRPVGLAGQADRRRTAGRHRLPLDRARHRHGRRRRPHRPSHWTKATLGGIAADSVVAFVVRPGNPKHIHGVEGSGQARSAGRDAGSVPLRLGEVERARGLRPGTEVGPEQPPGDSVGDQALQARRLAGLVRHPNAANTFFSGKGDVLITYESEAYAAFAAGKQGQLVVPKPTMLIQLPMVATKSAPAAAKAFIKYVHAPKQQKIFAVNGYRPVVRSVLKSHDLASWRKKYNTGPTFNISDKLFGGWLKANKVWFDLDNGRMVKIEQAVGGPTQLAPSRRARPRRHAGSAPTDGPLRPCPSASSRRTCSSSSSCRSRRSSGKRRRAEAHGFLAGRLEPRGSRGAQAHLRGGLRRRRNQRGARHDHGVGARPRRLPRQVARQLRNRPAVRPADDRRRLDAAHALRPELAGRDRHRLHAHRDRARALLRHAPVRHPDGAARADRARRRRWRRRLARSEPASSPSSGGSFCRTSCRGSSPAPSSRSPAHSARSAPSSSSRGAPSTREVASVFIFNVIQDGEPAQAVGRRDRASGCSLRAAPRRRRLALLHHEARACLGGSGCAW